jgi:hypothetical protein
MEEAITNSDRRRSRSEAIHRLVGTLAAMRAARRERAPMYQQMGALLTVVDAIEQVEDMAKKNDERLPGMVALVAQVAPLLREMGITVDWEEAERLGLDDDLDEQGFRVAMMWLIKSPDMSAEPTH